MRWLLRSHDYGQVALPNQDCRVGRRLSRKSIALYERDNDWRASAVVDEHGPSTASFNLLKFPLREELLGEVRK
jgi:hypothetical protein